MMQVLTLHWHSAVTWLLSLGSIALVLIRPKGLPEMSWAMLGACAASFVLPISNLANLVVYSHCMPALGPWLRTFALPSAVSVVVTFVVLRWLAAKRLEGDVKTKIEESPLSATGKVTLYGIGFLAITLMTASALNLDLGTPACVAGLMVAAVISIRDRGTPADIAKEIAWSVIPLVAGLFVIVEALNGAGALQATVNAFEQMKNWSPLAGAFGTAFGVALMSNVVNNLPSGLISGTAAQAAGATGAQRHAVLIGVDLGPNFSISGSLATILWLIAIRRETEEIGFWKFLSWGVLVIPSALALAVLAIFAAPQ